MNDHWRPEAEHPGERKVLQPDIMVLAPPVGNFLIFLGQDEPLPESARVFAHVSDVDWQVVNWVHGGQQFSLARFSGPVRALGFALSLPGGGLLEISIPRRVTGDIGELTSFLRQSGGPIESVLRLALSALGHSGTVSTELLSLLEDGTEAAGFIEMSAVPEGGGTFLQGWAQEPILGPCRVISEHGVFDAEAAPFGRPDILAPASGVCLFAKTWTFGKVSGPVFIEADGRILRLDPIEKSLACLNPAETKAHLREMSPRMAATHEALGWFRRLYRPRFNGHDTLSKYEGPVAAHCDVVLRGEDGGLFVAGWLLDPMRLVEIALIKSSEGFYAPIDKRWHRMQRPDLNDGFSEDQRFSGLLTADNTLHGFLCYVPAPSKKFDQAECYLELVLADGGCLFLPLASVLCRDLDAGRAALACIPQHDPAHLEIIKEHVVPFLAALPPRRLGNLSPLRCIGTTKLSKPVAALIAVQDVAQLSAIFAQLSDTEDGAALDLVIALDDTVPPDTLSKLDSQFRFYNLTGAVSLMRPQTTRAQRLDILREGVTAETLVLWDPAVLPKQAGWLAALRSAHRDIGQGVLLSPLLTYEDGTVHFGGARLSAPAQKAICAVAGISCGTIGRFAAEPVSAGAAEFALVDRELLEQVGGISGRLLGTSFCHHDLGLRLRQSASSAWFSPAAEFWVLTSESATEVEEPPLIAEIDASLIDHIASLPPTPVGRLA